MVKNNRGCPSLGSLMTATGIALLGLVACGSEEATNDTGDLDPAQTAPQRPPSNDRSVASAMETGLQSPDEGSAYNRGLAQRRRAGESDVGNGEDSGARCSHAPSQPNLLQGVQSPLSPSDLIAPSDKPRPVCRQRGPGPLPLTPVQLPSRDHDVQKRL